MHCSNIILKRAREGVMSDALSEPGDTHKLCMQHSEREFKVTVRASR